MKYVIEVIGSADGATAEVLSRQTAEEISPKRAIGKAQQLLEMWRRRGGDIVRVLNHHGEELYRFRSP